MKSIPLSRGKFALVDDEDYGKLSKEKWHYCNKGYALGSSTRKYMHRVVMNTPLGMNTDHINGNKLDNRKENLRVCTNSQNLHNRGKQKNNTSGYKGIGWDSVNNKWVAQVQIFGKNKKIGRYSSKEEAKRAHDEYCIKILGAFAKIEDES